MRHAGRPRVRPVSGSFHLPTAILVAGVHGAALSPSSGWSGRSAAPRAASSSEVDQATYATLHTASLAARHLRDGLTAGRPARGRQAPARAARLVGRGDLRPRRAARLGRRGRPPRGGCPRARAGGAAHRAHRRAARRPGHVRRPRLPGPLGGDRPGGRPMSAWSRRSPHTVPTPRPGWSGRPRRWPGGWPRRSSSPSSATSAPARWRPSCAPCAPRSARTSSTTRLAAIASFVRTDPDRARELLLEFADFTRYALRRGGAFTTLAEELRNVERYLVLEQARFGDRLRISLLIAPEVLPVAVPYLAVQPLVENAVRHGLATQGGRRPRHHHRQRRRGRGRDHHRGRRGRRRTPQAIRTVLDGDTDGDNVGLGNVDARLRQVFGDDFGLVVETAPGAGTKVTFRVPKYAPGRPRRRRRLSPWLAPPPATRSTAARRTPPAAPRDAALRALVVDDEAPALEELSWLLRQDDRGSREVVTASSGAEALRSLDERRRRRRLLATSRCPASTAWTWPA